MNWKKILLWVVILIVVFIVLGILFGGDKQPVEPPMPAKPIEGKWGEQIATDIPQVADGWSDPVFLEVSDENWADSIFVTADGNTIYYMDYPGDLMRVHIGLDEQPSPFEGYNADIYKSEKPFVTKEKVTLFHFDEDPWSTWGPMIDEDGNFFYSYNGYGGDDGSYDGDIYRNDERLAFNTNDKHDNPHYCKARDELWMNKGQDEDIYVLRNAAANNFDGVPELAPSPIYIPDSQETQVWLSPDCNIMYFASDRDEGFKLAIYKATRVGETDEWNTPEKVIWDSGHSVGEPTLTADGKRLFYEQVYVLGEEDDQEFTTAFFYIERIE